MRDLAAEGLLEGRHFWIHCINQHPVSSIDERIPWHTLDDAIAENPGKQICAVLDAHTEGPSWRHIKQAVNRMTEKYGLDPRCIIQWTGSRGEDDEPIQVVPVMDAFCIIAWPQHCIPVDEPTHHFVMLARIPKTHRVLAAAEILSRGLDRYGYLSCGCGDHGHGNAEVYNMVPDTIRGRFPLMLPGDSFNEIQTVEFTVASTTRREITGAFCSVIAETSHDLMAPNVCTAFMTEKSEKAFLLHQIPLWVAAPRQVALARDWGFDVFDDLIDHSYDDEPDGHRRIGMVVAQLERLCTHSLSDIRRFKSENLKRFVRNRERCLYLRDNHTGIQYEKLKACVAVMPTP